MSYASVVLQDNPVAYWRLNESAGPSAADLTGKGHTGTYTGTVQYRQAGPMAFDPNDAAIYLDGASGRVTVAQAGDFPTGAITMEAWILQATTAIGPILEFGTTAVWGCHLWEYGNPGDLWWNPALTTGSGVQAYGVLNQTMVWHHVVAEWDGVNTAYLYCDGNLCGFSTCTGPYVNGGAQNPFNIGYRPLSPGTFFTGRVDEVAIYNTALSFARVRAHYNAGINRSYPAAILGDNPVAWWRLNDSGAVANDSVANYQNVIMRDGPTAYWRMGGSTATVHDIKNGHNGTVTGTVYTANGALPNDPDGARSFDGNSNLITVPDFVVTVPYSVEFWMYIAGGQSGGGNCIINRRNPSNQGGFTYEFGNANTINFHVDNGTAAWRAITTTAISYGVWHHIVHTVDAAGNGIVYVDNAVNVTGAQYATIGQPASMQFVLGRNNVSTTLYFNGSLDEVSIFPFALSAAQVAAHYYAGRGHYGTLSGTYTQGQTGAITGSGGTDTSTSFNLGRAVVADIADLRPAGGGWSMEAWVKPTNVTGVQEYIRKDGAGAGYFIRQSSSTLESLFSVGGGGTYVLLSAGTITAGVWQHVVATYDGANVRHYINGILVGTQAETRAFSPNNAPTMIATQNPSGGSEDFVGVLDEIAVYNFALSATQVMNHYAAGMGQPTTWDLPNEVFRNAGTYPIAHWDSTNGCFVPSSTRQVSWDPSAGTFRPIVG